MKHHQLTFFRSEFQVVFLLVDSQNTSLLEVKIVLLVETEFRLCTVLLGEKMVIEIRNE